MSPTSACPRCQTLVSYAPGERPVCPTCGYPGPDKRERQARTVPPAWEDTARERRTEQVPPAWEDAASREHRHPPAEAWAERETSGKAVAALVLGIGSFLVLPVLLGILAIVFGVMARREIDASDGVLEGRAMATWGMWLGIVNIVLFVLFLLAMLAIGITTFEQGTEAAVALP